LASDSAPRQPDHRVRIVFSKDSQARFLSHLDLLATLEYAVRRARLPVALSAGFNPRPRLALAAPLPVGYLGEREILDLVLREPYPTDKVQRALQSALPTGLTIHSITIVENAAASHITSLTYRIALPAPVPDIENRIQSLLARPNLPIDDTHDGKVRHRDLRPLLLSLEPMNEHSLHLTVAHRPDAGTIRPEQILNLMDLPTDGALIIRERINLETGS
jgi:radical SAM-linked protein